MKHPDTIPIVDYRSPRDRPLLPLLAQTWIRILLCIVGGAALVIGITAINVGWYVHVLNQRLELARQHIPVIQQAIGTDPRFVDVEYSTFTERQGSLQFIGAVRSSTDLDNLKLIIAATGPPVDVGYAIQVIPRATVPATIPMIPGPPSKRGAPAGDAHEPE